MRQKVLTIANNFTDKLLSIFIILTFVWVLVALSFQLSFIYLNFSGKTETIGKITSFFNHTFDGRFKNSPENIMYNAEDHIWVESVTNMVKIGKLAGNRNLEFGVKNILEEYLQEAGYDLASDAEYKLKVNIVYLDVLTTKTNISVFHKGEEEVVVRLQGILYKQGKKVKEVVVEESSSEISMSTLIVDEGGKFNQTSLSNALKKGCEKVVIKLMPPK
jgi:hypothetical protein